MWYLPLHYRKNTTTLDSNRRHFKCTCTDFVSKPLFSWRQNGVLKVSTNLLSSQIQTSSTSNTLN
uniref:Uncharacterized protein n=1 Tax=Lepeophtheirus salmonis TaxID=72036 RepID=A0A0K2UYN3_LEPSM